MPKIVIETGIVMRSLVLVLLSILTIFEHASFGKGEPPPRGLVDCKDFLHDSVLSAAKKLNVFIASGFLEDKQARALANRFNDLCPKNKSRLLPVCTELIAEIEKKMARTEEQAKAKIEKLIESTLNAPAERQPWFEAYYPIFDRCENEPLRFECSEAIDEVTDLLAAMPAIQQPVGGLFDQAAKSLDETIEKWTFLEPTKLAELLQKIKEARKIRAAFERLVMSTKQKLDRDYQPVDPTVVLPIILSGNAPIVELRHSKVWLHSRSGDYSVIIDPLQRHFTIAVREKDRSHRLYDQWIFEKGKLRRAMADERVYGETIKAWTHQTHFSY